MWLKANDTGESVRRLDEQAKKIIMQREREPNTNKERGISRDVEKLNRLYAKII